MLRTCARYKGSRSPAVGARRYSSKLQPVPPYPNTPMWKHQDKLPRFPLPALDDTLNRLKEAIKPCLGTSEYQKFTEKLEKFRTGQGPAIHQKLVELEADAAHNWMAGFWTSMYLGIRDPQCINVSPFLIGSDDPNPTRNKSQVLRAASWLAATSRWAKKVYNEEIEAQMAGETPLCVYQLTQFLGASREPRLGRDEYLVYPKAKHFAVMCKNQFYRVQAINDDNSVVSEAQLAKELEAIKAHAEQAHSSYSHLFPVGVLSAGNRDVWATAKAQLRSISENNEKSFAEIDSALLVICIDDHIPANNVELCNVALHATPDAGNRYYDKTNIFFLQNGTLGVLLDHTAVDGITGLRYMEDVYADAIKQPLVTQKDLDDVKEVKVHPLPIETNPTIRKTIATVSGELNELIGTTQIVDLLFDDFGKEEIKKYKVSPDAFYQAAAHIATFRTLGKVVPTYESSSVSHYKLGRTETVRSLTNEMKEFVEKFHANVSNKEKLEAFQKAAGKHVAVAKASKSGQGQDRHLQGLYWKSVQLRASLDGWQIPEFFDENYWYYMSNLLSTSNIGGNQPSVRLFGFGPVHPQGLGVGYMINDNSLHGTVSSFTGKAGVFKEHLFNALRELSKLCKLQ